MLGIRNRSGVAIDLWVGHPDLFLCDKRVIDENQLAVFEEWNQKKQFVPETHGSRHVAFTPLQSEPPDQVLGTLLNRFQGYQRITVILHSVKLHSDYLDGFSRVFPEEEA